MRNATSILLGAVALFAMSATEASATIINVTYTGTVTDGIDGNGVFGVVGSSYVDQTYIAKYVFDVPNGSSGASVSSTFEVDGYYGSGTPLAISATVQIGNAPAVSIPVDYFAQIAIYRDVFGGGQQYHSVQSRVFDAFGVEIVHDRNSTSNGNDSTGSVPFTLTGPFVYNFAGSPSQQTFEDIVYNADHTQVSTLIHANVLSLAVTPVPEPSTWAMMILGFAGIGFLAYRRRNQAAVA